MFRFFRKKGEAPKEKNERDALWSKIGTDFAEGRGNPLEGALAVHLAQPDEQSITQLITWFGASQVHTIAKGPDPIGDAAMLQGPDGKGYVAVFTAREGAEAERHGPFAAVSAISALELVFSMNGMAGIVINPGDEHLRWFFTPQQTANLQTVYERSFNYQAGNIYSIRHGDSYRALKLLKADDGGVHVRIYGNHWPERPPTVEHDDLLLAGTGEKHPAIGHMPLSRKAFLAMGPIRIASAEVSEDELEGYSLWLEAKGGYFGT